MGRTFRKRVGKVVLVLGLLFVVLFVFRLAYGYTKTFGDSMTSAQFFDGVSVGKRNYASKKYTVKSNSATQTTVKVDQKYEKIAEIKTKSAKFEQEEKLARQKIEAYNALVQFEQKSGNVGGRRLNLVIGVPPQNFDSLYVQLIKIGNVQAKQITKKDKTNEYKELNAKKQSLENIRVSLMDLKSRGGKIEEYMQLENRILEIEQQLQDLGVSLGDFDDENEFCTVQFSLVEGKEVKIGIMQRIKVALEWTVKIYLQLMASLFFVMFFAYMLVVVIDKMKIWKRFISHEE